MGILVSKPSFNDGVIKGTGKERPPMLPLDHSYFFGLIFLEIMWIPKVIDYSERHASQTSGSYLRGSKF